MRPGFNKAFNEADALLQELWVQFEGWDQQRKSTDGALLAFARILSPYFGWAVDETLAILKKTIIRAESAHAKVESSDPDMKCSILWTHLMMVMCFGVALGERMERVR